MDIPRAPKHKRHRYFLGGIALAGVLGITLALSRLQPAAPTVERSTVWVDSVRRGPMVREVRGPGTLVAEQVRWVTALTAGRVERVVERPGAEVGAETVLLVLSNPDLQLEELDAQRELTSAEAQLVNLRATLETQRLSQQASLAAVATQYREALRHGKAIQELADSGLASPMELSRVRDQADELATRVAIERKRLEIMSESMRAQLAAQRAQVERLRAIAEFQRRQVEALHVRAGGVGVVQELDLEVGQWVAPGAVLAKVVQPGRLKAVLRIPETQAKDVALAQRVSIDTRNGVVPGRVVRIDPAVQNGAVAVDVALDGPLPAGARPDLSVDGTMEVERLDDVLYVGRPAFGEAESVLGLFKLDEGGDHAVRVRVRLGRASVNTIEIVEGLREGDRVILSDMSAWDAFDRVRVR